MPERVFVTVAQGAHILGVATWTIYSWRRRGHLSAAHVDPNGREFFDLSELEREHAADRRRRSLHSQPG